MQCLGEGGSIPFLGSFKEQFPKTLMVVAGVLGPESNAHGPNEMLELDFCEKLMCSLTYLLANCSRI